MKLKNLFPAALAVVALASCTTDEIESTGAKQQPSFAQKGDLRITSFDTEDVATRALANKLYQLQTYEDGDKIYVYDQDMHATDIYAYDVDENAFYFEEQFAGDEKQIKGDPSFGVFAGVVNKNPKGYVLRTEEGTPTCVDIKLPHVLEYKEKVVDGEAMYGFDIPAFAAASYSTDPSDPYIALDNYRYLTALLRVKLENAFGNVSFIRVSNGGPDGTYNVGKMEDSKALSGNLTAKLYKGDDRTNSKLEVVDEDYLVYPEVYIDLTNVPSSTSFIYIPIIAGLNGDIDHIKLEYTDSRTIADVEAEDEAGSITWKRIPGMQFPGKIFEANKRYYGSYTYELADMNPKKVSDLLAQYASTANDITLNITNSFTIDSSDPNVDNVIYLPEFENNVNVTINLADAFTTWTNGTPDKLVFTDVAGETFTGKVTLNVGTKTLANEEIEVDLEEGTAELVGKYNNVLTLTSAGKVKIGDGTNATSGLTWPAVGDDIKAIEIAKAATSSSAINASAAANQTASVVVNGTMTGAITGGAATKTITVGADGTLTGDITTGEAKTEADKVTVTIAGTQTASTNSVKSGTYGYYTDVKVSGKVTSGAMDLKSAVMGTLDITSTFTTAEEVAIAADVTTNGNVIVELGSEGEAISGKLTMQGCNKTLTLKNGYVNEINSNVSAGDWERPYININFDDAEGRVAFRKLTTAMKNEIDYNESTWSGEKITNTTYANALTSYTNAQAPEEKKNSPVAVFSAAQLATLGTLADIDIFNDIDLDDQDTWTGITQVTSSFDGLGHKISNLNLSEATARGLINRNSGTVVKNLVIENVKGEKAATAAKQGSLGALIGVQTGTVAVSDVEITGIDLKMTAETNEKIGGVIGAATSGASATLTDVKAAGSIDGYRALGGLIGETSIPVTATNCDASGITFAQTFNSGKAMDIDYAKIGGFIGTVRANVAVIITSGVAPASIAYGQPDKMYVSDISSETGDFFTYQAKQNFIGFSGNDNTASASKIAASTINGTNYCAEANFGSEALTHLHGTATYTFLYTWKAK